MIMVLLLDYHTPTLSFLLAKTIFGHLSFSKYQLGVKSSKPELKLMQDVLICRRQKGGWCLAVEYARGHTRDFPCKSCTLLLTLIFLKSPLRNQPQT